MRRHLLRCLFAMALLAVTAHALPIFITTLLLPDGKVGASYSESISTLGGRRPFDNWSISSGALPPGLAIDDKSGTINGKPTLGGTYNFTVKVTDRDGDTASQTLSIFIQSSLLTVTTSSLPAGTLGTAYSQTLAASGGSTGFSWSVVSGSLPAGLNLSPSGTIAGTPTAGGTSNFTVQVKDVGNATATAQLSITITIPPLVVTTASLPGGTLGAGYSQTLTATGGTGGNTWSTTAGKLPDGLTLAPAGTISGTPTAAGTANFTVQVKDSANTTATKALSINIAVPPLVVTTASLPNGMAGAAYSQTLAASGGAGGNTWAVSSGSLPGGLTLSSGGTISGTPQAAGTANFTVQVKDSANTTATKSLSIVINPPPLSVTTASLPNGTAGAEYSQTLAASGGAGGNTWSVTSGSLPDGLTLAAGGTISGTPAAAGTSNFTVQVKDSANGTATKSLSIAVNAPPLNVTTTSLPNGTAGTAYSQTLAASGGTGGNTWSITSGSLPDGLTLAAGGTISGTPTGAGRRISPCR